jgi:hypothetical protein
MPECVDCGAEVKNKNSAGHYREKCHQCIAEVAGVSPEQAAPIHGCECELCVNAR